MAANTNNNNFNASIPIFTGSDFQVWEQKMGDFLKSQHLWHIWHITAGAPGSTLIMNNCTLYENLIQVQPN